MSNSITHIAVVVLTAHLSLTAAAVLVRADGADPNDTASVATVDPKAPFAPYGRDTFWTGVIPVEPAAHDDSINQNVSRDPTPDAPAAPPAPAP